MEKASGQRNNAAKKSTDDVSQGHPVCIQKDVNYFCKYIEISKKLDNRHVTLVIERMQLTQNLDKSTNKKQTKR